MSDLRYTFTEDSACLLFPPIILQTRAFKVANSAPKPIYLLENTKFAFQLRWGITVFWATPIDESLWIDKLRSTLEADNIRILSWRRLASEATQFVVSTTPTSSPSFIIHRLKGRLHYATKSYASKALRSHYAIRSFGTQEREIVENYIQGQTNHHRMATTKAQSIFEALRYQDDSIDLARERTTSHGTYWYNLHVVLVHAERWCDVKQSRLERVQQVLLQSGKNKSWEISRSSILADHLHVALGCGFDESPDSIALSMMNNVAWVYEMKPILQFSSFVGTFGEYDHRVIQGATL
ncbi:MAG: hypothetical protein ACK52L_17970 [Pirellula sp.]